MSYSQLAAHAPMVFDAVRNGLYAQAIRPRIGADTVVMDLGAGLGIHGLVAAASGARRVYRVEPEPVLRIAMEIARANGLADRVVPLEGRIEDVAVPEPVDLIVSVFTGNLLFSEDLLPSLYHARDRHLKAGGDLVPDSAELMLAPVSAADLHREHVARWSEPAEGLDLSATRRFAAHEIDWLGRQPYQAERLAEPVAVQSLDLRTTYQADCRARATVPATATGWCHGLLGWIRIRLGDVWLGSGPDDPPVHWGPAFLPFDQPVELHAGDATEIALDRPRGGEWTWSLRAPGGQRRQSTFMAHADAAERLRRIAPASSPTLTPRGRAVAHALARMDGRTSNEQVADSLMAFDPVAFARRQDALDLVQALARRYGA